MNVNVNGIYGDVNYAQNGTATGNQLLGGTILHVMRQTQRPTQVLMAYQKWNCLVDHSKQEV